MQHPNHQAASGGGAPSLFPPPPPPPSQPPLPPGWEQANDPASGRLYYANRLTGETSWAPPPYFPPPPPPPPVLPPQQFQQQNQHFHHEQQTHMMYNSAPPAVPAQQLPIQGGYDNVPMPPMNYPQQFQPNQAQMGMETSNTQPLHTHPHGPGNNVPMPPNYPQQYLPNQPHVEINPSRDQTLPPNPHMMQQQEPPQTTTIHNLSSGLGPSTAITPGLLVPSVRSMIDAEHTQKSTLGASYAPPQLELEGLSAGAIADLCNVSRELKSRNVDGGDFSGASERTTDQKQGEGAAQEDEGGHYYLPLQPFSLPVSSLPPHIEPGRVDIRLHALHTKLGKI